jgi:hypothetical protein
MRVSRIVWRLWDEILNACGKRELVDNRNDSLFIPSNHFSSPAQPLMAPFCPFYSAPGLRRWGEEVLSGRKWSSLRSD